MISNQENLYSDVNTCFSLFQKELEHKGVWDNTVLIQVSDFARTNGPNANAGTDHAWGGNYIVMGGSVKGGQIVGDYPHLKAGAPLEIGRGRMIPTTPWEGPRNPQHPQTSLAGPFINHAQANKVGADKGTESSSRLR